MRHISPLSLANLADDPMFQLARAYRYAKDTIGIPAGARRARGGGRQAERFQEAADRLRVLRSSRACRRVRDDGRVRNARPGAVRDLRLLLWNQAHRSDPGPDQGQRGRLVRDQWPQRSTGGQEDRRGPDRYPDRRQRLHQGCAHQGVCAAAGADSRQLVRLSGHDGKPLSPLHHRRSRHHSRGSRTLLLGEGGAAAVLSAQRPPPARRPASATEG